jgi:SAM-dependent methyltransferase
VLKACKNCGQEAAFTALEVDSTENAQVCGNCGSWNVDLSLQSQLESIYSKDYFTGEEYLNYSATQYSQRKNFLRKLKILNSLTTFSPASDAVLELGCSTGDFLALLRERGFKQLMGVEVATYAREIAVQKQLRVISPLESHYKKSIEQQKPRFIFAWDVWEHLEDPAAIFDELLSHTAPDALIALTTVDASQLIPRLRKTRWRQFHPPSHVNYPTRKAFQLYFESRGYEVIYQRSFGMYRPMLEYLGALLKFWRKRIAQLPSFFHWPIYLNLYDTQLVVARKKRVSV